MSTSKRILYAFILIIFPLTLNSCSTDNVKSSKISVFDVKKIAVFPFINQTKTKDAGKVVSEIFISELHKTNTFIIEEPANVASFIINERILSMGELDMQSSLILGRRLKTDYILFGSVEEFKHDMRTGYPVVSVSLRLVDTNSGKVYWYNQSKKHGDDYRIIFDFGTVFTVGKLTKKIAKEMISTIH